MKSFQIKATKRAELGSKSATQLRREGMVPCVIYGAGENAHFYADVRELSKVIVTPEVFNVVIDVDGKTYETVLKDAQFHPVTDKPIHVDFYQLTADKKVTISLPVRTTGTSPGVRAGGKLKMNLRKMKVRAIPSALPEFIAIDIENLKIGEDIRVRDLAIDGLELLDSKSLVIVGVKTSRAVAADATEGGAAPAAAKAAPAKK